MYKYIPKHINFSFSFIFNNLSLRPGSGPNRKEPVFTSNHRLMKNPYFQKQIIRNK